MAKDEQEQIEKQIEEKEQTNKEETLIVRKKLTFRKRIKEFQQRYLEGEELLKMQAYINKYFYLYRNFEPTFVTNAGEIYFSEFPVAFGNEIHGRHPVVVLNKSGAKQQMITVVPLTSKSCNKVSDYDLGVIKGLSKNNEHSIAVVNQARAVDKSRLVLEHVIEVLQEREKENPTDAGVEISLDSIKICRLPKHKMTILRDKVKRFISNSQLSSHQK